ncbi:MAG: hypothetical protein IJ354_10810, partial [Clostridia bacterium]|nr:hypothetical protein [Clostridia bacterium]
LDHFVLADDDLADVLFECRNHLTRIEHLERSFFFEMSKHTRKANAYTGIITDYLKFYNSMTKVLRQSIFM